MIFDTFLYNGEADILECRIREISDLVDRFIIVESGETHLRPGKIRPSTFLQQRARFQQWGDKICHLFVPTFHSSVPIEREHEHREKIGDALRMCAVADDDIVIQSDVDEIPSRAAVGGLRDLLARRPLIAFSQSLHFFAVDWRYPVPSEMKPAACLFKNIRTFTEMRFASKLAPTVLGGGWHFSWMGQTEDHLLKIDSVYEGDDIRHVHEHLESGELRRTGVHVDGVKMAPIEVDESFPLYVRERRCPPHWFRPRGVDPPGVRSRSSR